MSDVTRKLLHSSGIKGTSPRDRCSSTTGSSYYSCGETSEDDDDDRNQSKTFYHSLSWEHVSYDDINNENVLPRDATRDVPRDTIRQGNNQEYGHSTISQERFIDPVSTVFKFIFLLFLCLIPVGDYFCSDVMLTLHDYILDDLDIDDIQYKRLTTTVLWTTIILVIGAIVNSYHTIFSARIIYGITCGFLRITVSTLLVKWFKTGYMSTAYGIKGSISFISSYISTSVLTLIYDTISKSKHSNQCLGFTLLIGVGICLISLVSSCFVAEADKRTDVLKQRFGMTNPAYSVITFSNIKQFPQSYWSLIVIATLFYIWVPFLTQSLQSIVESKYLIDDHLAETVQGMIYLISSLTLPIFGLLMDKVGKSVHWLSAALILSTIGHLLLAFTFLHPFISTVTLGISHSIVTVSVWPMVAYIIELRYIATAYGILNGFVLLGKVSISYLSDYIMNTKGFMCLQIIFVISTLCEYCSSL
ncbi:Major facilitator superfamily domain-containing protein 1 [Mactra antiquata]